MAILTATAGADNLAGAADDDTFVLGDGTAQAGDAFDGGAGFDTLSFNSAASATWDFTGVSLLGFEAITFDSLPDINANRIVIFTRAQFGAGGIADDVFLSGSLLSVERIRVDLGVGDSFSAAGWTFGEWSNDEITLNGSTGAETITGSSKNDVIHGGDGNDVISGGDANDHLLGEGGDDQISGGAGPDIIDGGDGNDTIDGGSENDIISGGAGNDTLDGGLGADALTGGDGDDTYVVDNAGDTVTEGSGVGSGTDVVQSSVTYSILSLGNVENLTLTGAGNIDGTGNALANIILGNSGNNQLDGFSGDDTIDAGAGNDRIDSSTGADTVAYGSALVGVTVSLLLQGAAQDTIGAGLDTIFNTENLSGSAFNDTLTGNGSANTLSGLAGNDTLDGGSGADTMAGGAGDDTYVVDNAGDVVTEGASAGTDTVQSSINYALGSELEHLTLTGALALDGTGNALGNAITGNSAANTLSGGAGDDTLVGGVGDDVLIGGAGDDVLVGGDGDDTIQDYGGVFGSRFLVNAQTGNDQVVPSVARLLNGNVVVVWTNGVLSGQTLAVRLFDSTGAPLPSPAGDQFEVGALGAIQPDVAALPGGGFVVTWATGNSGDIFLQRFDANGAAIDLTPQTVNSGINGNSDVAVFADGSFMIAYQDDGGGSDNINGRVYSPTGVVGAEFAIATEAGPQGSPHITLLSDGNLALSYFGGGDGSGFGIFLKIVQPDGTVVTSPIAVNTTTAGDQVFSQIVAHADGQFVVTWYDNTADSNIHAQIFQNSGAPVGGEFLLNTTTTGTQLTHGLIGLPGGGFFVAWQSNTLPDGSAANAWALLGRQFDAAGQPVGAEIVIEHAFDPSQGAFPKMTVLADGSIFVAYSGQFAGDSDADLAIAGRVISLNSSAGSIDAGAGNDRIFIQNLTGLVDGGAGADSVGVYGEEFVETAYLDSGLVFANIETLETSGHPVVGTAAQFESFDTITWAIGSSFNFPVNLALSVAGAADLSDELLNRSASFTGSSGDDILITSNGADTLSGLAGNDTLNGGAGADALIGGDGDDIYIVDNAGDVVTEGSGAGSGTDVVQSSVTYSILNLGNVENMTLTGAGNIDGTGNALANIILGNSGNNQLDGFSGDDTIDAGAGDDRIDSSTGVDTVAYTSALVGVSVSLLLQGAAQNTIGAGLDTIFNTENLSGSAFNDTLTGDSSGNTLSGLAGNDTLDGGAGVDALSGGAGDDTLQVLLNPHGLAGESYDGGADTDTLRLGEGNNFQGASFTSIERLTFVGTPNGSLFDAEDFGGAGFSDNLVVTSPGATPVIQLYRAGAGTTTLAGWTFSGSAQIELFGSTGDDTLTGSSIGDAINGGAGADLLDGGAGADALTGGDGDDTLIGGVGNDTLDGGVGADALIGSVGDDAYVVDNAGDAVTEGAGEGVDTVQSSIGYTLVTNVENLTLTGINAIDGSGNDGNNVVTGNDAANVLSGGADASGIGSDILFGMGGADTLHGGADLDEIHGGDGDDILMFNSAPHILAGETYDGGAGTDTLRGDHFNNHDFRATTVLSIERLVLGNLGLPSQMSFNWSQVGSGGLSTSLALDAMNTTGGVNFFNTAAGAMDLSAFTFSNWGSAFINVFGSSGADAMIGSSQRDTMQGGLGDDALDGGAGADILIGDLGDDVLVGGDGDDTIQDFGGGVGSIDAGAGNDRLFIQNLTGLIDGGAGADSVGVYGDGFVETAFLNAGLVFANIETLETSGHPVVGTAAQFESFDTITWAIGSSFNFPVNLALSGAGVADLSDELLNRSATFTGSIGDDTLVTSNGADTLSGLAGNDTLDGGAGADALIGGDGDDIYIVDNAGDTVTEGSGAGSGTDVVQSSVTYSILSLGNVENLTLTGAGNIDGTGNALGNIILGNSGNNQLDGFSGDDTIDAGAGDDRIDSSTGVDTVAYTSALVGVSVSLLLQGAAQDTIGAGLDTIFNTENLSGSAFDDALTGNGGANTLSGLAGNDTLDGGVGADTLIGGDSDDTYVVDDAGDVVTELAGEGADTVQSSISYTLGSELENLTLLGALALDGVGNALNNAITGNSATNTLDGGAGDDTLIGDLGDDTLVGGAGSDQLFGNDGDDVLVVGGNLAIAEPAEIYDGGAGTDTIQIDTGVLSANGYYQTAFYGTSAQPSQVVSIERILFNNTAPGANMALFLTSQLGGGIANNATFVGSQHKEDVVFLAVSGGVHSLAATSFTLENWTTIAGEYWRSDAIQLHAALPDLSYTLIGSAGDDVIQGNNMADVLQGGDGNDYLVGRGGADSYSGGNGDDAILIGSDDPTYTENYALVTFDGGAGTDVLIVHGQSVDLRGSGIVLSNFEGIGAYHTLTFAAGPPALATPPLLGTQIVIDQGILAQLPTALLVSGSGSYLTSTGDYLTQEDIISITMSPGDVIDMSTWTFRLWDPLQDHMAVSGSTANDTITGSSQTDNLFGGAGDDVLTGGAGVDVVTGGAGNDTIVLDVFDVGAGESADGGANVDTLEASGDLDARGVTLASIERLRFADDLNFNFVTFDASQIGAGLSSTLEVVGTAVSDEVDIFVSFGGSVDLSSWTFTTWNPSLRAEIISDEDFIFIGGNGGAETIIGSAVGDDVSAGGGNDTIFGGVGSDFLLGQGGDDTISAGIGDDYMRGGLGVDSFDGGDGLDRVSFFERNATQGVVANLLTQTISNDGFGNAETMVSVEDLGAGTAFADTFIGTDTANLLLGSAGDTLLAAGGDDTFQLDGAPALLDGGDGVDTITQFTGSKLAPDANADGLAETVFAATGVVVDLSLGQIVQDGYGGSGTLVSIENVGGSALDDVLIGDGGANALDGSAGNDTLDGAAGDDTLDGGAGADVLTGGAGVDSVTGGAGDDTIMLDAFDVGAGESADGGADVDTLEASGDLDARGVAFASIDRLRFAGDLNFNFVTFDAPQIGLGLSSTLEVVGTAASDEVDIFVAFDGSVDLSGWTFTAWNPSLRAETIPDEDFVFIGGSGGAESIIGSAVGDDVSAGAGNDTIFGGGGSDVLLGQGGDDTISAGIGDDYMRGGLGVDSFDGGDGVDRISFFERNATQGVVANLLTQTISNDGFGNAETMISVEDLGAGTAFADTFIGTDAANLLLGSAGDTLMAAGGDDTFQLDGAPVLLDGGDGVDTITQFTGSKLAPDANADGLAEIVTATTGVVVSLAAGQIVQDGYGGSGTLVSIENVGGSALDDVLTGSSGANVLDGFAGNDTLAGGAGADVMSGGVGNDTYDVDNIGDVTSEALGEGTDLVRSSVTRTLDANIENLTLLGGAGLSGTGNELNNLIVGTAGINTLSGLGGADTLNGGAGADVLLGGAGNDVYVVDNAGDVVTEALGEGIDLVQSVVTRTLGANVENLSLFGALAINGTGNELNNVLIGNGVANTLSGLAGNDTLNGGFGVDIMFGGAGDDTYVVDNAGDVTFEGSALDGIDTVQSSITRSLGANLENLTLTGVAAITGAGNSLANIITGNGGANTLFGNLGDDALNGGNGNDILQGEAGADTLNGGQGADSMFGGAGNDTYIVDAGGDITFEGSALDGTDIVFSSVTRSLGANLENLTLTGAAAINGGGNALDNILVGNSAANALYGNGGNDTLDGGLGADRMFGGAGDDAYVVDNAGDITFEGSPLDGTDLVQSSVTRSLGANLENLTLTGTAAINGVGNSLGNIINGNAGANQLFGNLGDDVLAGGAGNDLLAGGAGNDSFVFAPGSGSDIVTGFVAGGIDDSLDFAAYDGTGITWTITQIGANTVFDFTNGDQITLTNVIAANLVQTDPFGFG